MSRPRTQLRVLDHWDNLDRHVERGYAGQSIWDWHKLPGWLDPRYTDYARACASIGINGSVLTNVNANATSLTPAYLEKAAALAGVFRPYGVRVYLTARFSAPIELGGLKSADPLDPAVRAWWKAKVDEIYRYIPDFGGFLVKANSEGQPGPQDYQRTHADGANMLADALAPHGGIVMWRAFVYSSGNTERPRAGRRMSEFVPLDGKFADNVLVQVKNGPIDFQPREPFSPLFGAMPKTPLMMEFQITKEYLGFATHLAYLGRCTRKCWTPTPWSPGKGSTVAKVIDGELHGYKLTGMAGVANIGSDRNWSGSHFDQANWFAFGRLAWDPDASSQRHRRRLGAHDVLERSRVREAGGRDDDGIARGGGRLHDAARARAPDGHRTSLRAGAVGQRSVSGRSGIPLTTIAPTPTASDSSAAPGKRQQRHGAVFAESRGALRRSEEDSRKPAAVVPSCVLGSPHGLRAHAVGRTGVSLRSRCRGRETDAAHLGRAIRSRGPGDDSRRSPPSWPSRNRKRSGGATPAWRTSSPSRNGRCRRAPSRRRIRSSTTSRSAFLTRPGAADSSRGIRCVQSG